MMINNAARVQADFDQFIMGFQTLTLASVSATGVPEVSYAPFVRLSDVWYIYVSELAQHTRNMIDTKQAAVLLIEPEQAAKNYFARKRVTFQMQTDEVSRETKRWFSVMTVFESQFGDVIRMIKPLTDFHLMALTPVAGNFVRGFAQAYSLTGDSMCTVHQRRERDSAEAPLVDVNGA
jgi:hypothetical protein